MKKLSIKNSTVQFLAFVSEQGGDAIDIAFQNGDLWATEKAMAMLYGIDRSGIARHIKNILDKNGLTNFCWQTTAIYYKTQVKFQHKLPKTKPKANLKNIVSSKTNSIQAILTVF